MRMTERQRELAAQIIDARQCSLSKDTDPDYVVAAAFVFDNGIFFLGSEGMAEVARQLRITPAGRAALEERKP